MKSKQSYAASGFAAGIIASFLALLLLGMPEAAEKIAPGLTISVVVAIVINHPPKQWRN